MVATFESITLSRLDLKYITKYTMKNADVRLKALWLEMRVVSAKHTHEQQADCRTPAKYSSDTGTYGWERKRKRKGKSPRQ